MDVIGLQQNVEHVVTACYYKFKSMTVNNLLLQQLKVKDASVLKCAYKHTS